MADMKLIGIDQSSGKLRPVKSNDSVVDNIGSQVKLAITQSGDFSENLFLTRALFPWTTGSALATPATLPSTAATAIAFSPNNEFLVVGQDSADPRLFFYQRTSQTFNFLSGEPSSQPTSGFIADISWSVDGEFVAVAHTASVGISIYQRSGSSFTKLANPATTPGTGRSVAFSPNGEFLVVFRATTPFIFIYQRSGTTFTKLADPATLPTGGPLTAQEGVAWSPNGEFLAVAHLTTPFVTIYQRDGTTFTKLADPATLPTGIGLGVGFSSDNEFLAVGISPSPFAHVYQRSGTTFTKLVSGDGGEFADSADMPTGNGRRIAWSPDNNILAIAADRVRVYQTGSIFTSVSNFNPSGTEFDCSWSSDQQYLAIAHTSGVRVTIQQTGSTMSKGIVVIAGEKREGD